MMRSSGAGFGLLILVFGFSTYDSFKLVGGSVVWFMGSALRPENTCNYPLL
jgi:hypothetical protein